MESWEWGLIAIGISILVSVIDRLSVRGMKAEAAKAVEGVSNRVTAVEIDLAKNYVRGDQLRELKEDNKKVLRQVTSIRLLLAEHFGLRDDRVEADLES